MLQSKFNRSIPLSCKRKKKRKKRKISVTCNASYMCMCALSHMCMPIHTQKCPVTLIINPVPLLVCKEIDSLVYSHDMTRHTWMPIAVRVFVYGISCSNRLMWVSPAATVAKGYRRKKQGCFFCRRVKAGRWAREIWIEHKQVIIWRECQLTWLQHTHIMVGKVQNGFPHLSATSLPPRSQPKKPHKLTFWYKVVKKLSRTRLQKQTPLYFT